MQTTIPIPPAEDSLFGPVIYAYTRAQAVADGFQIRVPDQITREAGFKFPVFINRTVWEKYVEVPAGVTCQDVDGRLWDVLWMLHCAANRGGALLRFQLYVRNDNRAARLVTLKAQCGPLDLDDPQPAITIMLPEED